VSRRWRLVIGASRVGALRRGVEVLYDRVAGPGPRASAVARTRLIDDLVSDARAWIGQLVLLGAGFDARAYRLSGLEQVSVFEVDHPATQQAKREVLGRVLAGIIEGTRWPGTCGWCRSTSNAMTWHGRCGRLGTGTARRACLCGKG
jgi:Leucine carboxyl methyltransferase